MPPTNEERDTANPYAFVVGCPRSGTTLLQRMLDAHPDLGITNDTHFIPRAIEAVIPAAIAEPARAASPALAAPLIDWARHYHRFVRLGLDDMAVDRAARTATTYPEFVSHIYNEVAHARGKRFCGEKTPDYVRHLPMLHQLFPTARMVHIVRDGRDVALSTLEWARPDKGPGKLALWQEEPVAVCALWWRWQVHAGRSNAAQLGVAHYHEVSYEALVCEPGRALRDITGFLTLPYDEGMLAFNVGKVVNDSGLSAKKAWRDPTPGLRDWRTQMDARSVALFEALAGDLLAELGYPLACNTIDGEIHEVAQRCRVWWDETAARKDLRLRERATAVIS